MAERIGRTQSAVSHALRRLRLLFDDPILVRTGQRMAPSPKAQSLRAPLADVLRRLEGVVATSGAFEPGALRREMLIAATDWPTSPVTFNARG